MCVCYSQDGFPGQDDHIDVLVDGCGGEENYFSGVSILGVQ